MVRDSARYDPAEMRKIRRDLRLGPRRPVSYPDADATLASLAPDAETKQGPDQPFLQPPHISPHVSRAHLAVRLRQIQHCVRGALARPMVRPLPAPSRPV